MQTVTDALVLRERKLDEQDRLLTLLSADRGIITAYAKGAGRMKGSMAGATELLCYSHFVLFQNRERCFADSFTLSSAENEPQIRKFMFASTSSRDCIPTATASM